jgi:RND family efflux transporter MFP subunit
MILTAAGCSKQSAEQHAASPVPPIKGAIVATVTITDLPEQITAVGTVRAETSALLAARIPGVVATLAAREGDRVKKGQTLLTLHALESTAGAAGAAAGVEEATRSLDEARSRRKLAETTFTRYEKMLAEQAVTRQEFDQRQSEREVATQGVARAEARLTQAREAAKSATAIADYTRVIAPISGVITQKNVDLGATVFPGSPLLTVEENGRYRLELAAPESLLGRVRVGQKVAVTLDGQASAHAGTVNEVVPHVDPATRTFLVKVSLPATSNIRSGQYGQGAFTVGSSQGITVPRTALREQGAITAVWIIDQAKTCRLRIVKPGRIMDERVEVIAGLANGDQLIVGGTLPTVEGARVE